MGRLNLLINVALIVLFLSNSLRADEFGNASNRLTPSLEYGKTPRLDDRLLLRDYSMDTTRLEVPREVIRIPSPPEGVRPDGFSAALAMILEGFTELLRSVLRWGPIGWVFDKMSESPAASVAVIKLGILFLFWKSR